MAPAVPVVTNSASDIPPASPAPEVTEGFDVSLVLWALVGLLLAGTVVGGLLALRRRREEAGEDAVFTPPVVAKTAEPSPDAVPPRQQRSDAPPPSSGHLTLDLDTARMSASLVNATLSYSLVLRTDERIEDLVLRGNMISAHASVPAEEQLELADAPVLHRIAQLAANQSVELKGDIRLPLAAITPIRHGAAALFVPLVRFEVLALRNGAPIKLRAAFVVGLEEAGRDSRLAPFRLDQGPRIFQHVGSRALSVPAFA